MKTGTKKKVTLMLDERVYSGLRTLVGDRGVGAYLSQLAKPYVIIDDIEAGYKSMAKDISQVCERTEWLSGAGEVAITEENTWRF